jgi:MFS family permease
MLRKLIQAKHLIPIIFCLSLAIFYLYDYLLRVLPSAASNGLDQAYDLTFISYGSLCASYYFIYVPMQLVVGVLVDRYQLTKLMLIALVCCAFGCVLFANAQVFWLAEIGRLAMGFGAGFIFITVLKIISVRISGHRFALYLGAVICIGMLGGLLMDSALVFLMQKWGWRLVCYLLALVGILLVVANYSFSYPKNRLDKTVFEVMPLKRDIEKLKQFFTDRRLLVQCVIAALLYLPIAGFAESWGIRFLNHTSQLSPIFASFDMSMLFLGFAVGAPILGWFYGRTGEYQLILTVGAVATTILLSIVLYVPELSAGKIGIDLFLLGFASASTVVILALNRQLASKYHAGKVFGVTNFFMTLAGGSAWLVGLFIHLITKNSLPSILPVYGVSNYQLAFLILPAGSLLAVFLTFYVCAEGR